MNLGFSTTNFRTIALTAALSCLLLSLAGCLRVRIHGDPAASLPSAPLRVVSYNVSLYDESAGGLVRRLETGDPQARKIAAVLQQLQPDLLLLNEFDHDPDGRAAALFERDYLGVSQGPGLQPLRYAYRYFAPVNTGEPSGLDLNDDGRVGGEGRLRGEDAWGYGLHPGQYGMLVLSRHPIDAAGVRSFRLLRWSAMPGASRPMRPDGSRPFHPDPIWRQLRLSSKSHWDVPVRTPHGVLHLLASHPTPPVFDGPEDRNGARNADELRLWREYLDDDPADRGWLCDDAGRCGGLPAGARFVIAGDLNNDPVDGDGRHEAMRALLDHPRVLRIPAPRSEGAVLAGRATGGANASHRGDPAEDSGDFGPRVGNLRLDYVLPSTGLRVLGSGVFWPAPGTPDADAAGASDHRAIWVDLSLSGD
jgi:endonuclease/exonuclease/phosphatase family metal-dependent hydrolase